MSEFLPIPKHHLNLHFTLACGQAFRWRHDCELFWTAPVGGKVIRVKEVDDGILWETIPGEPDYGLFSSTFRLDDDIERIYGDLSSADFHLAELVNDKFAGLRLLRQDPTEALLSYVCSTVNSVPRIQRAIEELSEKYGRFIVECAGRRHYAFPEPEAFISADPEDLWNTGSLAWRGPNIAAVARQLQERPDGWLESLREASHEAARTELMTLRGIGAKIADCVCLFALDKDQAVPVDTHIRQVAERFFMPEIKLKTITAAAYRRIENAFWERYGQWSGWAQEFLFYEDLLRARKRHAKPELT
jgi:N-glycosylase/DNA lyase